MCDLDCLKAIRKWFRLVNFLIMKLIGNCVWPWVQKERVIPNIGDLLSLNKEMCVLCSFQLGAWNYTLGYYGSEQLHVGSNSPPGLGRTQGCGFWVDMERYPNLKEKVGGLIHDCEIFSLLAKWSTSSCGLVLVYWPSVTNKKKKEKKSLFTNTAHFKFLCAQKN